MDEVQIKKQIASLMGQRGLDSQMISQRQIAPPESPILQLLQILLQGGDSRLGGDLPIGGKAYANGIPQGGNFQGLTGLRREDAGHDSAMNYHEARLQDELAAMGLPLDSMLGGDRLSRNLGLKYRK